MRNELGRFVSMVLFAMALPACAADPPEGGQPSSYDAKINPRGALSFPHRSLLETYEQNNTPATRADADALASTGGDFIAAGTVVRVTATAITSGVNPSLNDTHLCQIAYPADSGQSTWVECWDLHPINLRSSGNDHEAAKHGPLPNLVDTKDAVGSILRGYEAPPNTELLSDVYVVPIGSETVRTWVDYVVFPDGTHRVAQVAFSRPDGALSPASVDRILKFVLPSDSKPVPRSNVRGSVADDAHGLTGTQSIRFLASRTLAGTFGGPTYYADGKWRRGMCPATPPALLEVFRDGSSSRVTKLTITAAYAYYCEQPAT